MERRFCHVCQVEGAVLSPADYRRLRLMFDRVQRQTRGRGETTFEAALEPLFREYRAITGEEDATWVHIVVHQLGWQPRPTG
jgi:hypothetical protein